MCSILANVGVLAFFKYFNFINSNVEALANFLNWNYSVENLKWILPIGLSFHTFQAMSYTVEVYRGNQPAERHFGIYALYVMFYPQLVAGPIERPQNILHQFKEKHPFALVKVRDGLVLIGWGLFKKVVIADRLATLVDPIFNNPQAYEGDQLLIATILFSFQIFCDFSGYSDIAIGSAQVLGITLMNNFDRPYFAKSIPEFWSRWHISLSTWFRDYLYIPLGGNRVSTMRRVFNILVVFIVSGLWHGANWTFIIWGAIHGIATIAYFFAKRIGDTFRIFKDGNTALVNLLGIVLTFSVVTLAWIFFRAATVNEALLILNKIVSLETVSSLLTAVRQLEFLNVISPFQSTDFLIGIAMIFVMELIHYVQKNKTIVEWITGKPVYQRWAVYYFFILSFIVLGKFESHSFIYFQF